MRAVGSVKATGHSRSECEWKEKQGGEQTTPTKTKEEGNNVEKAVRANFLDRLVVARIEEEIEQRQTALRVALVCVRADCAVERKALRQRKANDGGCESPGGTESENRGTLCFQHAVSE